MGPRAEEGRGKAAISLGESSSRHSRGFPNRRTGLGVESGHSDFVGGVSRGTETSKYPEEKKSTPWAKLEFARGEPRGEIPLVVANERGTAQTNTT